MAQGGYLCDVAKRLGQSCALIEALNPQLAADRQVRAQEEAQQPTTSITTAGGSQLYVRPGARIRAGPCSVAGQLQQRAEAFGGGGGGGARG